MNSISPIYHFDHHQKLITISNNDSNVQTDHAEQQVVSTTTAAETITSFDHHDQKKEQQVFEEIDFQFDTHHSQEESSLFQTKRLKVDIDYDQHPEQSTNKSMLLNYHQSLSSSSVSNLTSTSSSLTFFNESLLDQNHQLHKKKSPPLSSSFLLLNQHSKSNDLVGLIDSTLLSSSSSSSPPPLPSSSPSITSLSPRDCFQTKSKMLKLDTNDDSNQITLGQVDNNHQEDSSHQNLFDFDSLIDVYDADNLQSHNDGNVNNDDGDDDDNCHDFLENLQVESVNEIDSLSRNTTNSIATLNDISTEILSSITDDLKEVLDDPINSSTTEGNENNNLNNDDRKNLKIENDLELSDENNNSNNSKCQKPSLEKISFLSINERDSISRHTVCPLCENSRSFCSSSSVTRHLRSVHKLNELSETKSCYCLFCSVFLEDINSYYKHFISAHQIDMNNAQMFFDKKKFSSIEEFNQWKENDLEQQFDCVYERCFSFDYSRSVYYKCSSIRLETKQTNEKNELLIKYKTSGESDAVKLLNDPSLQINNPIDARTYPCPSSIRLVFHKDCVEAHCILFHVHSVAINHNRKQKKSQTSKSLETNSLKLAISGQILPTSSKQVKTKSHSVAKLESSSSLFPLSKAEPSVAKQQPSQSQINYQIPIQVVQQPAENPATTLLNRPNITLTNTTGATTTSIRQQQQIFQIPLVNLLGNNSIALLTHHPSPASSGNGSTAAINPTGTTTTTFQLQLTGNGKMALVPYKSTPTSKSTTTIATTLAQQQNFSCNSKTVPTYRNASVQSDTLSSYHHQKFTAVQQSQKSQLTTIPDSSSTKTTSQNLGATDTEILSSTTTSANFFNTNIKSNDDDLVIVSLEKGMEMVQERFRSTKERLRADYTKLLDHCLTEPDFEVVENALSTISKHLMKQNNTSHLI